MSRQSWPEGDCLQRLTDADADWALETAKPRRTYLLAEVLGIPTVQMRCATVDGKRIKLVIAIIRTPRQQSQGFIADVPVR